MHDYILAIDQGTTSTRAIVFDERMVPIATAQQEFTQYYPASGLVEHDAEEILDTVRQTGREAIKKATEESGVDPAAMRAIGITNQRETLVLWDRETGKPLHRAIVWQDRRTHDFCQSLKSRGLEPLFTKRTGLLLDPYFSGTKLAWLLDQHPDWREAAKAGKLCFGTIDSFLIFHMSGGKAHVTDATNAARTLLYDIDRNDWDAEILEILNIPPTLLPEVKDCADDFGTCTADWFGIDLPVRGVAGDQHAATLGNGCFEPGAVKATYGTGCFMLMNVGATRVPSHNRLLSTIGWRLNGQTTYALEGSIYIAGAAVQWLRDGLGMIEKADQTGDMAANADPEQSVYLVPAFTGLGAPHWDSAARGAIFGLTRNTGPNEFARAALESVCYQTLDLVAAMQADCAALENQGTNALPALRVDGGMSASDWTMQRLSDLIAVPVDRPQVQETTALGAAWLAGYAMEIYPGPADFAKTWQLDRRFTPQMAEGDRQSAIAGWQDALSRTLSTHS